jgi:endonuclease G
MGAYQEAKRRDRFPAAKNRRDILVEDNPKIVEAIEKLAQPLQVYQEQIEGTRDDNRFKIRKTLIESDSSDPNGFERVLGESDLVSVNFLTRGSRAAAAVCRIRVPTQGGEWYGTGFLVGPRLLMTNNHVLSSSQDASQAEAEFNYEHDADGVLSPPIQFNLAPDEIFFTDIEHDVTLASVAAYSEGGVPIERFGYLPLIPLSGKGVEGEWVTIIQHPGGQPKQLTIRASMIIELDIKAFPTVAVRFIHYTTDTEPGSSGSPVINDQWQVIAIHHKAIRKPSSDGDEDRPVWLANEGVRVSAIFRMLEAKRFSSEDAAAALNRLSRAIGMLPLQASESVGFGSISLEAEGKPLPKKHWSEPEFSLGYDSNFLPVELDLNAILGGQRSLAEKLTGSDEVILDYLHFSSVIHSERKFPMLTAVNIHGSKLRRPENSSNSWRRDNRIDEELQPGDNFYVKSQGDDPVAFDRGHLVRRLNPCWGDKQEEADLAEKHTFHFTNAAPQVHNYNDIDWGDLEDYVLDRTQTLEKKVTVFSGPVFKSQDPEYGQHRKHGPWKIPITFWKIAVIEKLDGNIAAAAFMVGQIEYLQALFEARVFTGLKPFTLGELQTRRIQTTIETVEQETGFDFSTLRQFDTQNALESTRRTRFLLHNNEIII